MDRNTKYILHHAFLLVVAAALAKPASAQMDVLSRSESGLSLAYRPHACLVDTLKANGKTYTRFSYDNHSLSASPGAPMLPETRLFFASPSGVAPAVELSGLSWTERPGVTIAPMPRLEADGYGFYIEIYNENPLLYALSGYRPESFWNLNEVSETDGLTTWELIIRPLLFDAHAQKVAVADSFDIQVSFGMVFAEKRALPARLPDHIVNRDLFSAPPGSLRFRKTGETVFDPFGKGDWYRIKLSKTGIYRINGFDLSQAGFPVGKTQSEQIRMYYGRGITLAENPKKIIPDGLKEIAIQIEDGGDGVFDQSDAIIFYGSALSRFITETYSDSLVYQNHPYSTENVYWITLSDQGIPLRMQSTGETPSANLPVRTSFPEITHTERENYPDFPETGIQWYWEEISSASKSFAFSLPGVISSDSTTITVKFLNDFIKIGHVVNIYINDDGPYNFEMPSSVNTKAVFSLYKTLKPTGNIIKIVRINGQPSKVIRLDWMEVEYERRLEQYDSTVEFFIKGDKLPIKLTVANIEKPKAVMFDTTDPYNVTRIAGTVYSGQEKMLTAQVTVPSGTRSRFVVTDPSSYMRVSSITMKKPLRPTLRAVGNGRDYCIISHNMFLSEAQRLASWRARDSKVDPLSTMVVDVEDIYDEFAWGVFDPVSIRDFLKYAWENYRIPIRYCLFFGDTIWKYKNLDETQMNKTFVPTMYIIDEHSCIATDDFFTWFDSDPVPYLATGRLCVDNKETARTVVDKIIDYERNPEKGIWHNRMLFIGDDELTISGKGQETEYSQDTENLESGNNVLSSLERRKIMEIEYPLINFRKPDATEALIKAINDGYLLMNYIGHGNKELIAHEHILEASRDIERLNNGFRQSVFYISSCSTSDFDLLDKPSLSEQLVNRNGGGCVAVIGAAELTYNLLNYSLNTAFYRNLFGRTRNPDYRIGEALRKAKISNYWDANANRYVLLGDPATRLMLPRYTISTAQIDTVYRLEKLDLSGNIVNGSRPVPYSGMLYIKAQGPKIHKVYSTTIGKKVNYSLPGKTFYNGYITISGSDFISSMVIPKDLAPTGGDSKIYFFATGDTEEAAGMVQNFAIGDLNPGAPDDTTGPEIKLSFDGKSFEDGDYIRRQPVMAATITDPSGINIYGNRGHNISLMIDDSEIVVLTDRFQYVNSYTSGTLSYTLPILASGEHTFEVSAYDSYNNISKKRVSATVTGSETGEIAIENLLNYPNPMNSEGTTFTFNLNDDAGKAMIKLYSQSGRLVDSFTFPANNGYNTTRKWQPPFELANGVYFYKLIVWSFNGRMASKIEKLVVMR